MGEGLGWDLRVRPPAAVPPAPAAASGNMEVFTANCSRQNVRSKMLTANIQGPEIRGVLKSSMPMDKDQFLDFRDLGKSGNLDLEMWDQETSQK